MSELLENSLDSSNVLLCKAISIGIDVARMFAHDMYIAACTADGQKIPGNVYTEEAYIPYGDSLNELIDEYEAIPTANIPYHDADNEHVTACGIIKFPKNITVSREETRQQLKILWYNVNKLKSHDTEVMVVCNPHIPASITSDVTSICGWVIAGDLYLMKDYEEAIGWLAANANFLGSLHDEDESNEI